MAIILKNKSIEVPGLVTISWKDGKLTWLKEITDWSPRNSTINKIVGHTHKGLIGTVLAGKGPNSTIDEALARYQVNTDRKVSWDYTIDFNAEILVQNDPEKKYAWQAGSVDDNSIGFEIVQRENGDIFQSEIDAAVLLIDVLTLAFGIQRQIPWNRKTNKPKVGVVKRLEQGGNDVVGFVGHRNITTERGAGDPGDSIYLALKAAGYELFDLDLEEDLTTWKGRQKGLGFDSKSCDGIAGPKTIEALKKAGKKTGLWVERPIDKVLEGII